MQDFHKLIWQMVTHTHMHDETKLEQLNSKLYHYTSMDGLLGILTSNKMWATSAMFLNDYKEITYGFDLVKEHLQRKVEKPSTKLELDIYPKLIDQFSKVSSSKYLDLYILCFSESRDKLSQWKGFADQGNGCALAFDSNQLLFQNRPFPFVHITVKKVIYDKNEQYSIIDNEISKYIAAYVEHSNHSDKDLESMLSGLTASLCNFITIFKDPTFAEEVEWRAISRDLSTIEGKNDKSKLKFRVAQNLIPYLEFDLSPKCAKESSMKLPIVEVILGAKVDFDINSVSLTHLLDENDWGAVDISKSTVPLR